MFDSADEGDLRAEALQLLKTTLASATGDGMYQSAFDQLTYELSNVDAEIARCVKAQVTKASSFIDLLVRAQETVETTKADALKLTTLGEETDDLFSDISILMQQVGHSLSNALETQELYEKIVSVPARTAIVMDKWAKRDTVPVSVYELQKEMHAILRNRDYIKKVPKQYVSSLPHSSTLNTVQLEKLTLELASVANSFDNTFFKTALDFSQELFCYITVQMPALIFSPSKPVNVQSVRMLIEQFILNLSAQETMEERGAAKAWKAIVDTIYTKIIPNEYESLCRPQRSSTSSFQISRISTSSTMKGDAAMVQESALQGTIDVLMAKIRDDFAHIRTQIVPLFNLPAASVIVETYYRGTGESTQSDPLSPNSTVPVFKIFNLPFVYVSAIHNFVQGFLRSASSTATLTQNILHSLISFASFYTTELETNGFNWIVCRFPNAAYFQNLVRNMTHSGLSSCYTVWYSSLTTISEGGTAGEQESTSKYAISNYATMYLDSNGRFLDLAPFSAQACMYPCMFDIHACVLKTVEDTWNNLSTTTDKAIVLDTVLNSLSASKGSSMQTQMKNALLEQKARDVFFVNAYSLEMPMQSVVLQYKKDIHGTFCKACYKLQLSYVQDLDRSRRTSEGTLITGVISTIFSVFLEQLHATDLSSDLGRSIFLETFNAACMTLINFIYDIIGNIFSLDPPINIQFLCKITDNPSTFHNLLTSDVFWSVKREGLSPGDFHLLSELLNSATFISPQALGSELTAKTDLAPKGIDSKFSSLFNMRRRPRQALSDSTTTSVITSNRTSTNLTGVSIQETTTTQSVLGMGQSMDASSDTSSTYGNSAVTEPLWAREKLEMRHYVALANDIDLISNSLEDLTSFALKKLQSDSITRSIIDAQVASVTDVISEALHVVSSKLAYVILSVFRVSHFSKLFTPAHDQTLVNNLTIELRDTINTIMSNLSDTLQYMLQIELSNLLPAAYFCAMFWRYYETLKVVKEKSFSNTSFANLYEADTECICKMLREIGLAERIAESRSKLMQAFEVGLKTIKVSTDDLTSVSTSISGASMAVYLLMHPKIQGHELIQKLMNVSYKDVDFYRAPFLDRALYRGQVYNYEANCKEAKFNI